MARSLYRIYLYIVTLGMLIFAAVGLALLLGALLGQTPLRDGAPAPTRVELVQRVTFWIVSWAIAGALGAVHYRLIRRDIAGEAAAGTGAIRAFFLNGAEAMAALVAVALLTTTISQLAYSIRYGFDASGPLAFAIAALGVAGLLEWERRRIRPSAGLATVFQRLHLYGVPLLMLFFSVTPAWLSALNQSVVGALSARGLYQPCVPPPLEKGVSPVPCTLPSTGLLWLAALVPVVALLVYAGLAWTDLRSGLRQVAHLISLAYGVIFVLVGVDRAAELIFRAAFGAPAPWAEVAGPLDFVSPLVFGVVVVAAYGAWLRREAAALPMGALNVGLTAEALVAGLLAAPFWWGLGLALHQLFEWVVPAGARPTASDVAGSLALLVTGVAYIGFALRLRRRSLQTGATGARRAFVLTGLAAGIITGAVGAAVSLYALGTTLLGAPLEQWQQVARTGLVALVVGAALAGIYGVAATREHFFGGLPRRPAPSATPAPSERPAARDAVDEILDDLVAGRLTHEEAANRLRALTHARM